MMKKLHLIVLGVLAICAAACASVSVPADEATGAETSATPATRSSGAVLWEGLPPESHHYVNRRLDEIEAGPVLQDGVIFVGDSITDGAPLYAMFPGLVSANHGIAWDTTQGVLLRIAQITRHSPDRIFIMIGTNDTGYTDNHAQISENIFQIVAELHTALPGTDLYVVSVLPRGGPANAVVTSTNRALAEGAAQHPFTYLDLASAMRAENGEMNPSLSYDNLHLNIHGYALWADVLGPCVWSGCPDGLIEGDPAN